MLYSSTMPRIMLRPGSDKRFKQGYPWVYSNEVRMTDETKAIEPGSVVSLSRNDSKEIGVGTFNPHSLICYRAFTRNGSGGVDRDFLAERLQKALNLREKLYDEPHYRMVYGDSDGLPGLVIDRFGDVFVVQTATAGMDHMLEDIQSILEDGFSPKAIIVANSGAFRKMENLETYTKLVSGELDGHLKIRENGLTFYADPLNGQKTGWFFDQGVNRAYVAGLTEGQTVLDLYSYAGGFGVTAAAGGATEVTCIDRSESSLGLATMAASANDLSDIIKVQTGEVFAELEKFRTEKKRFGVVIADPPAFVKSRKDLGPGAKGYRKLAKMAADVVEPGGFLFIASCSYNMFEERFIDETAHGISQAGRAGRIIHRGGAGPDHPLHPYLPESAYLKGLVYALD
jgi:23S rRNA (cytosine1962-C5)-methyltransferase